MNLQPIHAAAIILGVSDSTVRRAIADKKLPCMSLGNRSLVDVDIAVDVLQKKNQNLCDINAISEETGLNICAIRRGIREGWIPAEKSGRAYVFDLNEVKRSIEKRMK